MKKSIRNALIFLFGLVGISFVIQMFFFTLIKNLEVGELGVINKIVNGKINADVIICGASRSFVGVNPELLEKEIGLSSYNISLNGSRLGAQLPLLKLYLKTNSKPKIIIQELGMYSLSIDEKIFAPYKFLPHLNRDELYNGLKILDSQLWVNKYIPLFNLTYFNTDLQKLLIKDYGIQFENKGDYLEKGFHPNPSEWSIDEENFLRHPYGIYNEIDEIAQGLLLELVTLCKNENIKLIFINTPEYYKILPLYKYRDRKMEIFKNIANENDIEFLDYSQHELSKERGYFYNFTHLNKNGANEFSNILSVDLFKIIEENSL